MHRHLLFVVVVLSIVHFTVSAALAESDFAAIDRAISDAVARGDIPGAVLLIHHDGETTHRQAYGSRSLKPTKTAMTADTIFDMASLTKPIATATSVCILIDRGKIDLHAPVAKYLPEFGKNGKEKITVEHLLRHTGGLIPDNHLNDYKNGAEKAWENICGLPTRSTPGEKFTYTDVGFIVLGELVKRVSGKPLDAFAKENIFEPLKMSRTAFNPPDDWRPFAPAEQRGGEWMRGDVHDPRAYLLGGVAGHAGLFSTVDDLSRYARMLLNGGELDGTRILSEKMVTNMTRGRWLADGTSGRGLGWDVDTGYSSPRGHRFPRGVSFGHTGFTGTSLWIDPVSESFVILLTNRVHPDGKGKTVALRRTVATLAADALLDKPKRGGVLTGVDVLKRDNFAALKGKKVAVITNLTGVDREGNRTIDLLHEAEGVELVKIFSPEHGLFAKLEGQVGDTVDVKTQIPVLSLYGETRRPTEAMLQGVDTIVFDIQSVGARFYTYITTLGYAMEAAAKHGKQVVVLDRPNPITGTLIGGPLADEAHLSFIAYKPLPLVHGMTIGELATLLNKEFDINCKLTIVKMDGWRRDMWFDETGLTWINPSPNMRNTTQALLYPGVALLEASNISVGRGTDQPFEQFGAPWIDGERLATALNAAKLPGLRFVPIAFTPDASRFRGERCEGVYLIVTDREEVQPVEMGFTIAWHLNRMHGSEFDARHMLRMCASQKAYEAMMTARQPSEIAEVWKDELAGFKKTRVKYLMYE